MLVPTALTLALFGFIAWLLIEVVRQDGAKIAAALQGRSWAAEAALPANPVTVRFSPRYTAAGPEPARAALRAAA